MVKFKLNLSITRYFLNDYISLSFIDFKLIQAKKYRLKLPFKSESNFLIIKNEIGNIKNYNY
jgi:hypothetical protein